jgi:hypothetical protein
MLATQCISQQATLGWNQFLRGRISKLWRQFYSYFKALADPNGDIWTKKLVLALWAHTESLWKNRNAKVHGGTVEEQKRREKDALCLRVEEAYAAYTEDNFIIPRTIA